MKTFSEISKKYRQSHKGILTKRYLEMKAEAKKLRLKIMDRKHYYVWSWELSNFRTTYYDWYESGHEGKLSPVIDRIDKKKGFVADNLKWTAQKDKNRSNGKPIKILEGDIWMQFGSAKKAELELGLPKSVLSRALRTNGKYKRLRVMSLTKFNQD